MHTQPSLTPLCPPRAYMHLRCTASQQVNQGCIERHDGVSQVYPVFFRGLLTKAVEEKVVGRIQGHGNGGYHPGKRTGTGTHCSRRRSLRTPGPSRAGSSEMRMASSMAASSPEPPSPRRAGPKHSGLRINSRTTTLAFSSTLSPGTQKVQESSWGTPTQPQNPTHSRVMSGPC